MKQRWVVKPPPPLNEHEAAYIEHGRMKAWVDRKICPLVLACWKRGWETESTCENIFAGAAHIVFRRCSYLQAFLQTIATAPVDWNAVECVIQNRVALDASWMASNGYKRKGSRPFWASEDGVLFPLAYAPAFLNCVSGKES